MRNLVKNFLLFLLVFLAITALFSLYSAPLTSVQRTDVSTFIGQLNDQQVKTVVVRGAEMDVTLKDGTQETVKKESTESFSEMLRNYQVTPDKIAGVSVDVREQEGVGFWLGAILPILIPFVLIAGFLYFMMRQVQGANSRAMMFGQSRARQIAPQGLKDRVTFKDVAGVKEAKEELQEVVEFLRQPKRFLSLGARIPKGVLLVGPPGTGKTLLARAVAGEANVPFFNISGSEFVEMFVGVGASRVRDLFRKAKRASPCIVFIDELDAVGRQRGAGLGGSNDEREQTLNQILVEMDGFDASTNIIILAATNRPDILDVALLRPGRFDRRVVLDMPDINDREEILKVHAKGKPFAKTVQLRDVAERTPGFTGADLSNLLNEAALLAARRNKKVVEQSEIMEGIERVLLGPERRSHLMDEQEKKITAFHEAGHALVAHELPGADPVRKISIISRGRAAGYTLKLPEKDKYMKSKAEYTAELAMLLAGYEAELAVFNQVTTGASNDLREATRLARRLIMEFGMSDKLGPRTFGEREELIFLGREIHEQRDYSEKVAEAIDAELFRFINEARKTAREIITGMRGTLEMIVQELLRKETLEREEFEALFKDPARAAQTA
ncbi:MAG: ATP-dependent zinc metalloprotease FtsH [Patescibacteria group bacterium]|nr:ATP-dependent zinc metalloprotease FtsH [Patescibacteria group bacterium]